MTLPVPYLCLASEAPLAVVVTESDFRRDELTAYRKRILP